MLLTNSQIRNLRTDRLPKPPDGFHWLVGVKVDVETHVTTRIATIAPQSVRKMTSKPGAGFLLMRLGDHGACEFIPFAELENLCAGREGVTA